MGCVATDQYRVLDSRMAALERETTRQSALQEGERIEFQRLKGQIEDSDKTARENYAELKYEVQQMKENFYRIQGQIEELQHNLGTSDKARRETLEKRLDRLDNAISKNYEKVIALERYMGFEPSETRPAGDKPDTQTDVAKESEEGLYALAKKLFDDGDKENARIQFENFINKYPGSKNADNARFWIADAYYAEKWYEKAILEYQKVLEAYPDSNKGGGCQAETRVCFCCPG